MSCILWCLLGVIVVVNGKVPSPASYPINVWQSFIDHEIVPDLLKVGPTDTLKVTFATGFQAMQGNDVKMEYLTEELPTLEWEAEDDSYYTLMMLDADAPSRRHPEARAFLHWLVGNIPGNAVEAGDTFTNYLRSNPEPGTGPHRYIFLVYEQPGVVEFREEPDDSFQRRANFSPEKFSKKYDLGSPIAGNFYLLENDEY